jgi:hypothetical protein
LAQHAGRIVVIFRLAHHFAADQHDGVRAQHHRAGPLRKGGARFFLRQPPHVVARRLRLPHRFINGDREHLKGDTRGDQQVAAPRRRRCEYEHPVTGDCRLERARPRVKLTM